VTRTEFGRYLRGKKQRLWLLDNPVNSPIPEPRGQWGDPSYNRYKKKTT